VNKLKYTTNANNFNPHFVTGFCDAVFQFNNRYKQLKK